MLFLILRRLPQTVQASLVPLVIAVGEVEPSDVHAGLDEPLEGGYIPTGRPEGADDLRLAGRHIRGGLDGGEGDVRSTQFGSAGRGLGLHGYRSCSG